MAYQKTNVLKELRRIKRATVDPRDRAFLQQAEAYVKLALAELEHRTDVAELEMLYRLQDPRG